MRTKVDRLSFAAIEQQFPLGDTARGMLAVVAPILNSLLLTINVERLGDVAGGDHRTIRLRQLAYLHRMSDGARGTAFEYAVHHGVRHCDRGLVDPLLSVLEEFGVGDTIDSIFFAQEKQGVAHLIDPERHFVTESTLIVPGPGQDPMSLQGYLPVIGKALRQRKARAEHRRVLEGRPADRQLRRGCVVGDHCEEQPARSRSRSRYRGGCDPLRAGQD